MKVNVKILRGPECTLDVQPDLLVLELKKMVENSLKVPVNEQKLLIKGKLLLGMTSIRRRLKQGGTVNIKKPNVIATNYNMNVGGVDKADQLTNWKKLNDYDIKENSKLNLVVLGSKESTSNTSKTQKKDILEVEMTKFLRKYFTESDAKKITAEYMKEFYRKASACNLEDWERIATGYLNDEKSKQKPV